MVVLHAKCIQITKINVMTKLSFLKSSKKAMVVSNTAKQKRELRVSVTCPDIAFSRKSVQVHITIENAGNTNLEDVHVEGSLIALERYKNNVAQIVFAEGNPVISANLATWNIGDLAVGEVKKYSATIVCQCGKYCFEVIANSMGGAYSKAECRTSWKGGCNTLLLECIDTLDPVIVNEETSYIIEVTNLSTATDRNIKVDAVFPKEIQLISTEGVTPSIIENNRVSFFPYAFLQPNKKITWKIKTRAIKPGDLRIKVHLTSENFYREAVEGESTKVY